MKMKKEMIIASLLLMVFACGGSGGTSDSETNSEILAAKLVNTSWIKSCSPSYSDATEQSQLIWHKTTRLSIDNSLKATYKTAFYGPSDTACESLQFDAIDIANLELKDKRISIESIEVNALNEHFIYNSNSNTLPPNYTIVYLQSERLYFGQKTDDNHGKTPETRHSSISLDDYFVQQVN